MYNETLRKITSLSLLTILLTSTAAFAMPNALPQAHAATNANLFVSAENSQFNNYFAGPQVIQVVVADPDINRLDQSYGEPTVTVNGKKLRMAQATDGNWYAYFADSKQAQIADSTAPIFGKGLNFGQFCGATTDAVTATGVSFSETKGIAVAGEAGSSEPNGTQNPTATITATCSSAASGTPQEHVVRENKTLNNNGATNTFGQIGLIQDAWPVIQLYDFASIPSPVTVDYQKAGGDQIVNLVFDRIPTNLIHTTVDRTAYPANSQVFVSVNDPQLNIDPTEEDSWTWGANTTNNTMYYMAFNRNGEEDADNTAGAMQNLIGNLTAFNFNHNGKLTINPKAQQANIIEFQDTGKQVLSSTTGTGRGSTDQVFTLQIATNSAPVTLIESAGVNTGTFVTWDGAKKSDLVTPNSLSIRGQSGFIRYNDVSTSIVGNFGYGTISVTATNGTWQSGQQIPIKLVDADGNLNSKITEHRDLFNPAIYQSGTGGIPTMTIGTPFSLATLGKTDQVSFVDSSVLAPVDTGIFSADFTGSTVTTTTTVQADAVNVQHIDLVTPTSPTFNLNGTTLLNAGIIIDMNRTMGVLQKTIHSTLHNDTQFMKGFNFLNYDLRSLATNATRGSGTVSIYLVYNTAGSVGILDPDGDGTPQTTLNVILLATTQSLQGFVNLNDTQAGIVANGTQNTINLFHKVPQKDSVGLFYTFSLDTTLDNEVKPIVSDFASTGIIGDGTTNDQRINNGVYRWELEETGDNTSIFTGTTEYTMLNQLNIFDPNTYSALRTINHQVKFVAIQDMLQAENRAPQATYEDLGADGQFTIISAQQDILTHTGVVSFDSKTYKIADTVTITLNDADLNVDNDLIDIYTVVNPTTAAGAQVLPGAGASAPAGTGPPAGAQDPATDTVGARGLGFYSGGQTAFGRLLDIQFGQSNTRWENTGCFAPNGITAQAFNIGFADTGFTLVETGPSTGLFTGTFEIPDQICSGYVISSSTAVPPNTITNAGTPTSTVGQNIKVNYVDFRDESGKSIEISDNAGIRGNTGSITLDKSVYPVPFGSVAATGSAALTDFATTTQTSLRGVFPVHRDDTSNGLSSTDTLTNGDTIVHVRVNDADYNLSPAGTDHIATGICRNGDVTNDCSHGPVWVLITRQSASNLIAFAGGPTVNNTGVIKTTATSANTGGTLSATPTAPTGDDASGAVDLGPMTEIDPASGIFQADVPVRFTDGPANNDCPNPQNYEAFNGTFIPNQLARFDSKASSGNHYCLRQGDVITVYYNDTNDASGHAQTVTDSGTFDLRNGVLQSDKSVYIIGSDMILTLVEPDLNLDSQQSETTTLDLVEWDSHAFKGTMGALGLNTANFDAKPNAFVETGKDTGIFQSVIKIPKQLSNSGTGAGTLLERGEQIHLEYTDWGPAGSKTVGDNNQDIQLTIYTSNFGATVELDQKVYTWTDRVYITVVAPDHNFDPNLVDTIGDNDENQVTVSTRGNSQSPYKLVESGVDTGIFTGYVILTGDNTLKSPGGVDGDGTEPTGAGPSGVGPTDGFLPSEDSDGVSVSFEFTRDQTVTGSALIRWNIGETKWLEASYPANGQGVLQIVDPDMNLNPKAVDKFDTNVWSDSDSGGIKLTMTETGEATGIFQGTVYFTTNFQSSGNRLHVAEGDTVTGEYKDRTLPAPYTPADQLRLTTTTFIGTVVPPLERAPASNPRIVDSFGNALTSVKVNQQIQITADLTNGQDRDQPFAYLVQIQDANGVTVSLSWITGTLTGGQSLNPAQSWTPTASGTYTAQIFVWQSIDNPNALSPPLSTTITVA